MKEIRNYDGGVKQEVASRNVTGYALVFNSESKDLGGFTEVIDKDALQGVIERSDILALLNHNEDKGVLARSTKGTGSLELTVDDLGLLYRFEAPKTALGDELIEGLRRGDIRASSFTFDVAEDSWEKKPDGTYLRTIKKIKNLYDISPVYRPAYDATSSRIDTRGLDSLKEQEAKEEAELAEKRRKEELKEYFDKIKQDFK